MGSFEYKHGQTLDAIDREEKEIHKLRKKKEERMGRGARGWSDMLRAPPIGVDSRSCLVVVLAVRLASC